MEKLDYKGYIGSIEYNKNDKCMHGKVLGLSKKICIIYEGHTIEELYNDFKEGIDHYLEDCREDGIQPEKTYYGLLNIQIPSEINTKVFTYIENHGISIDDFICDSIEKRLEFA